VTLYKYLALSGRLGTGAVGAKRAAELTVCILDLAVPDAPVNCCPETHRTTDKLLLSTAISGMQQLTATPV